MIKVDCSSDVIAVGTPLLLKVIDRVFHCKKLSFTLKSLPYSFPFPSRKVYFYVFFYFFFFFEDEFAHFISF